MSTPVQYNARDVQFEIEDPDTDTWVPIDGINTFSPSHGGETADTTLFGSQGEEESQKMSKNRTIALGGRRLMDLTTGALDPGQAVVEKMDGRLGNESLTRFRFAHKDVPVWTVWTAHFQLGDSGGGGNNDLVSWNVTVTRSGATTTAAKA
ncbi:phage tail tube protein [Streptomyces sp. URMC 129]|uniref:phage tail tube protein n=1 Tax=Streptomyces sp. URMC 129 TaxID=3423407 RepID=UPI003F1C4BC8